VSEAATIEDRVTKLEEAVEKLSAYIESEQQARKDFRASVRGGMVGLVVLVVGQLITVWIPSIIQHVQWIQGHP